MGQPIPGSLKQRIGLGWDMGHMDWHVFLLFIFFNFTKKKKKNSISLILDLEVIFNLLIEKSLSATWSHSILTILQVGNKCY